MPELTKVADAAEKMQVRVEELRLCFQLQNYY